VDHSEEGEEAVVTVEEVEAPPWEDVEEEVS
jgi:hypothetical protein